MSRLNYVQNSPLNVHSDVSRGDRNLIFGVSLPLLPYSMHVISEGSSKSVHMGSLT